MSIVAYLNRRTRELTATVDQTFFRLMESTAPIDRFIPVTNYAARELLIARMTHNRLPMAQILAPDEEVKAVRPQMTLNEILYKNVKLGQKLVWTERDFELLNRLNNEIAANGAGAATARQAIQDYFFGNVQQLVGTVYEKALMLALRVACLGQCNYTDPISGEQIAINYSPTSGHIPAALTGTSRWSQASTCTPLANLQSHSETVYNNIGRWPQAVIMHFTDLRRVADSTEAKTAVMRKMGGDSSSPSVAELYLTDQMAIDLIRERTRATEVVLFDAQYTEDSAAGTQTNSFFLPADYYLFSYEAGYIERAFMPTVERDFAPGLYQINDIESRLPRREFSAIAGAFVPFVRDERLIVSRNVNNTAIT